MSISLAGIPVAPYVGTPFSQPMQVAGKAGRAVKLSISWQSYGAGFVLPNVVVQISLAPNQQQTFDLIRSIYIDNSGSAVPIFVIADDTQFTVEAQAYSVGWYPVFTNQFSFKVAGLGFTKTNVGAVLIYVTNVSVNAFTDVSLQSVLNQSLASPVIGGGSGVANIAVVIPGQDYNNGNLSITGAGVTGATAVGTLDQWGRFTGVTVSAPGAGALGPVTITPTGGQSIPPAYVGGNIYTLGQRTVFGGTEWTWNGGHAQTFTTQIQTGAPVYTNNSAYNVGQQSSDGNGNVYVWTTHLANSGSNSLLSLVNSGFVVLIGKAVPQPNNNGWDQAPGPVGGAAQFSATLGAQSSAIITSGFGPEALGDQAESITTAILGAGVFADNLFGTPFASGFIYLTHFRASAVFATGAGLTSWVLETVGGFDQLNMAATAGPFGDFVPVDIQKANIKLDATQQWRLRCTSFSDQLIVVHTLVWSYSAI